MEVKVRLGPTQRNLTVPLYPPPTLGKFQTDVIKLFKLPNDVTLLVTYKNERNQFIPVQNDADFNDALKAREKQRPSFQVTMSSKKAGEAGSGRNITSPAVKSTSNSSLSSLSSSSKAAVKDGQRKKKEPAPPGGPVAGDNPLHEAVRAISPAKVAEVSSQHPSYRTEINAAGLTPLHLAAQLGHLEILSLLLTSGCLIDEVDMQQNTALHQAAVCGHLAICRSLLQGGANLLLTNNSGCTVLHLLMGCEVAHEEKPLFRILVNDIIRSFRFNMNARNTAGATALHIASSRGYRWNMKVLLMHNPDINAQSKNGDTALHIAARQGDKKMAQRILDKGADTDILNEDKHTPLQIAQNYKHPTVIELLAPITKTPASAARTSEPSTPSTPTTLNASTASVVAARAALPPTGPPSPVHAPSRSAPAQWAPGRTAGPPVATAPASPAPVSAHSTPVSSPAPASTVSSTPSASPATQPKDAGTGAGPLEDSKKHASRRRDSSATKEGKEKDKMRQSTKPHNSGREQGAPATPPVGGSTLPPPPVPNPPPPDRPVPTLPPPVGLPSPSPSGGTGSVISPLRDSPNIVVTRDMVQGEGMEAMAQLLKILGLAQWIDRFRQEDIDLNTARELQDDTLQILGLPVGSRLRLIRAIRNIYEPQPTDAVGHPGSAHSTPRKPAAAVASQPLDPALLALLQQSDLTQYAEVFRLEELNLAAVKRLSDAQLKELGLTMGARIRLLDALSKLK